MTMTPMRSDVSAPRSRRQLRGERTRSSSTAKQHLLLAVLAFLGIGIMLYPSAAQWVSALHEQNALHGYAQTQQQYSPEQKQAVLQAADDYNRSQVSGLIVDPFSNTGSAGQPTVDAEAQNYLQQLNLDANGIMSELTIPGLNVQLPVYHGATEDTLRKGVGHLYGSSLPVGGDSTHAVLTGHSGLPEAAMFTDLSKLHEGDRFTIDTFGRTLTYAVTSTETVEPTDIENLKVQQGKDLVTLVTCTPIGINSHRLLVHAERVPNTAEAGDEGAQEVDLPGIPWAFIALVVAFLIMVVFGVRVWMVRRRS